MATITEVKAWSDSKLVEELRNPARERFPVSYTVLLAEAMARLLEGRIIGEMVVNNVAPHSLEDIEKVVCRAMAANKKGG